MSKNQSSKRKGAQQLFYTEAFKQKIVDELSWTTQLRPLQKGWKENHEIEKTF